MPLSVHSVALAWLIQQPAPPPPPPVVVPVEARRVILGSGRVLLPEGTYFRRAPGRLLPRPEGAEGRGLRFLPEDFGDDPKAAIPLAPSPALELGEAIFAAGPVPGDAIGQTVPVELSGEILSYRGRNWILADFIVPLRSLPESWPRGDDIDIPVDPADPVAGAASAQDVVGAQTGSDERGDIADELERRLRQRIGDVGRALQTGSLQTGSGDAPTEPSGDVNVPRLEAERRLIRRRGVVVRDNDTGGWQFVPVTQDGGSPDPPSQILASSIVEVLERTVRAEEGPIHLLVTGRVVRYHNEHWLRVATFDIPRSGRSLRPGSVPGDAGDE